MLSTSPIVRQVQSTSNLLESVLLIVSLLFLAGCMERIDADLEVSDAASKYTAVWRYTNSFGRDAKESQTSDNPWEIRFEPNTFKLISGLYVTSEEVWVCDLGISRIQVFDYNGMYIRSLGAGIPIEGTLASDMELFEEQCNYDRKAGVPRWEDDAGILWWRDQTALFKVSDVVVMEGGILIADQARTGAQRQPKRLPRIAFVDWDGITNALSSPDVVWPEYLAADGKNVAFSEPDGNALWLAEVTAEKWPQKLITDATQFNRIMEVKVDYAESVEYAVGLHLASNAGSSPGDFNRIGGVALAFDKLIVCDSGNHRLQIFDNRRDDFNNWARLIRVIPAGRIDGSRRFDTPLDIDVDPVSGMVYVLDAVRHEVAVLSPTFERVGAFGRDELVEPFAIDISPNGNHCFVTDRRNNQVHHYVQGD
jgi:hypothetical protein